MVGSTSTNYLFDGAEVIQETVWIAATTHYTRGLGDRVGSRHEGAATPNYHYDSIGSVVGLTGGTTLTDSYSYTAFGEVRDRTGTTTQPYLYVGNAYDSDSKLYDFHARMHNSPRPDASPPSTRSETQKLAGRCKLQRQEVDDGQEEDETQART